VTASANRTYADLHEHLDRLGWAGLLNRIDARVDKETGMDRLFGWSLHH
jgi:hypothetical protein